MYSRKVNLSGALVGAPLECWSIPNVLGKGAYKYVVAEWHPSPYDTAECDADVEFHAVQLIECIIQFFCE